MFDIRPLFDLSFWFARKPAELLPTSVWALLISLVALLLVSVALRIAFGRKRALDRHEKHTHSRVVSLLQTTAILGLVWLFFAYEQVTILQWRWWVLLIGLGAVVWAAHIVYEAKRLVPRYRDEERMSVEKLKYMPRPGR